MHGETSVGEDPTPPVDPVPVPAPQKPPRDRSDEEPAFNDEPDLPAGEPSGAPNEPGKT